MTPILFERVKKTYPGGNTVIEELDLTIDPGSFTILVGPSGCGKTTLLRMIANLEAITDGKIYIGDQLINGLQPGECEIAMVFQNYAIYPHMSVRKNIDFGLKNLGIPKEERDKRITDVLAQVGLSEFIDSRPASLSGGQRQRVALARAISKDPKVFLMDEPLSNLDAKLRSQMRSELVELHRQLKSTFVFVTHDQVEAMTMGDCIVVMSEGKIMQKGAPKEVYKDPKNLFVATFIGDPGMNLLKLSNNCTAGFRPKHTRLFPRSAQNIPGLTLEGKVTVKEVLGGDFLYLMDTPVGRFKVKTEDEFDFGDTTLLQFLDDNLYYFDPEEQRIYDAERSAACKKLLEQEVAHAV
ncbi:MAG: ATP-binding cassette domain-containing protein [Thermoleophilia bacterium]|nr:ATP-binding cassette domain-containing protein [Thermoleophilia bacterium]